MRANFKPIGIIHSPHHSVEGMPIQARFAKGVKGSIELREEFIPGLVDLDGFSHLILIYWFHKSQGYNLEVTPFLDNKSHGVFSTRAPKRPNSIGISVVKLLNIDNHVLEIENVDILSGTPLLDIKPYIREFDVHETEKEGWFSAQGNNLQDKKSDGRFCKK